MSISYWRMRDRYYRLIGSKCNECGTEYFPNVYKCRKCGSENVSDKEMPRNGHIITYTVSYQVMDGFEDQVPLIFAIILLENSVKTLGQIVDTLPEEIQINDPVTVVFRKIRVNKNNGQIMYGYKFKKIKQ